MARSQHVQLVCITFLFDQFHILRNQSIKTNRSINKAFLWKLRALLRTFSSTVVQIYT